MEASTLAPDVPQTNDGRELPRYIRSTRLWALQIKRIELSSPPQLHFEEPGYGPFATTETWIARHHPRQGGWYVMLSPAYAVYVSPEDFQAQYLKAADA